MARREIMSEYFLEHKSAQNEQIRAAHEIGEDALEIVDNTYGSGYPLWTPGVHELAYHNGHHGRAVGAKAVQLCDYLGLGSVEQAVAKVAGYAHDIAQLNGRGVDEAKSATWLTSAMQERGAFSQYTQTMGALAIVGTEPIFSADGKITGQKASELSYPNKASELVAKSVASADLGELYTPQGPYFGHQLAREIFGIIPGDEFSPEKLIAFQQDQLEFIENYTYPLAEAEKLFATHKTEVIAYGRSILHLLEKGEIASWDELIRRDEAFMEKHAA